MYDDAYTRNSNDELAVRTVASSGDTNTNKDDVFTRDNQGRLCLRTTGNGGGGGGGDVSSVNGKTGDVVLDAEDVGALPADTPIPAAQVQSDWAQTDTEAVDYIKNKPVIPTSSGVPQYTIMPTASASNVGEIAQYSGETIPDVPASAVATQTVGSGLSDLQVNVDTFIRVEQPTGDETVDFVASVIPETITPTTTTVQSNATITIDPVVFLQAEHTYNPSNNYSRFDIIYYDSTQVEIRVLYESGSTASDIVAISGLSDWGITIDGELQSGDSMPTFYVPAVVSWAKDSESVDISAYGISYTGTPADGDTISVAYTPFVAGITNGYFYKSSAEYSDPTATISQTTGSGLSDLAVNVDTFIEAEQPTQDETVDFTAIVTPDSVVYDPDKVSDPNSYLMTRIKEMLGTENVYIVINSVDENNVATQIQAFNQGGGFFTITEQDLVDNNVVISNVSASDTIYLTFVQGTTTWEKDSETVDLATYGISFSGTPNNGDVLTVAYTAPALIGYYWNQTDVQPSSGGGNAGIEWKTKVDLSSEYTGDTYNAAPYYTIVGGLPDGEYEFYFSTKTKSEMELPVGEVIFKAKLIINNSAQTAYAQMGYVFDGNYMPDGNNVYGSENLIIWNWVKVNNNDLILFTTQRPWASAILAYNNHQTVPECFKLSAIKNVETGQEYVAVGAINLDGSYPAYTSEYSSQLKLASIVSFPSMPTYYSNPTFNASDINNYGGLSINTDAAEVYVRLKSGDDEFYGFVYRTKGNSYEQEILVSTGVFANCVFGSSPNNHICLSFGGTPAFVDTVYVSAGSLGGTNYGMNVGTYDSTIQTTVFDFVKFGKTSRFTTPTANQIGGIVQYIGETDANYTKGYSYTGVGTIITVPESFTPSNYSLPDFTLTIDDSNFMSALVSITGWSEAYIREMLQQGYGWAISYDGANSSINYVNWGAYGNFINDAVTQCFTVITTQTADVVCDFRITYTPETKVVQNGRWELFPVQPLDLTSVSGYDATKTQILKNVQGVLTWVDE